MKAVGRRDPGGLSPTGELPTSGEIRVRVRYCECDPMGVAHHSACIAWFEMGRTELLRSCGVTYRDMEHAGIFLVVARMDVRYKAPAHYDDELLLVTRVSGGGRARIDHAYELWRYDGDPPQGRGRTALLVTADTTLACVDENGRPRALPEWMMPVS